MKKTVLVVVTFCLLIGVAGCSSSTPNDPYPQLEPPISHLSQVDGFAGLIVTDRETILSGIYQVYTPLEFLDALMSTDVKIIEVMEDLSLGSIEVKEAIEASGKTMQDYRSVYRPDSRQALTHPHLIEAGVGQVRIVSKEGLMIYSNHGAKITKAGFLIDNARDIVFRNLAFGELWEWDELDRGQYKRNDWDYFLVEKSNGVWFDHLTFEQAYDGIIDMKEHAQNITISHSKFLFTPNAFIEAQITHLENHQNDYPFYQELRNEGESMETLMQWASYQKKGFNLGNTTDGENFETITVTFHHLEVYNLQDRFPRLRKGDVHLYHVHLNNEDIYNFRTQSTNPKLPLVNQGLVPTEDGAILLENSRFSYVQTPIKNHQDSNPDSRYTGKFEVRNSELVTPLRVHFSSSTDRLSQWVATGSHQVLPFAFRNHTELPYQYQLQDVYYLSDILSEYPTGAGVKENFSWLRIINEEEKGR